MWQTIRLENDSPLLVGCLYRPPPCSEPNTASSTDISISRSIGAAARLLAAKVYSSVVLVGDFNMPDVDWSDNGTPVLASECSPSVVVSDAISLSSLIQIVSGSTFISPGQTSNLLDLVLVSDSNFNFNFNLFNLDTLKANDLYNFH